MNSAFFDIDKDFEQKALVWSDANFSQIVFTSNASCKGDSFKKCLFVSNLKGDMYPYFSKNAPVAGYSSFDFKNTIFDNQISKVKEFAFLDSNWFESEVWIYFLDNKIEIFAPNPDEIFNNIINCQYGINLGKNVIDFQSCVSKNAYIDNFIYLQNEIKKGNLYITNYCISFDSKIENWDYVRAFFELQEKLSAPFTSFVKHNSSYLLSSSPERFLGWDGKRLLSKPIKGTTSREIEIEKDKIAAQKLFESEKERNENVMIVDLVRNDLSRIAYDVKVDELFGIYPFSSVYQMISTISCIPDQQPINWKRIFDSTFPMGSMTGAPKEKALNYIDRIETFNRELYSGTVGYVLNADLADFNVVIRGVLYNQKNNKLSIRVGSACTDMADAENEWEECLLKAKGVLGAINGKIVF